MPMYLGYFVRAAESSPARNGAFQIIDNRSDIAGKQYQASDAVLSQSPSFLAISALHHGSRPFETHIAHPTVLIIRSRYGRNLLKFSATGFGKPAHIGYPEYHMPPMQRWPAHAPTQLTTMK